MRQSVAERRMEDCRTSAVNLLLSIQHDTEWQQVIEILHLAQSALKEAAEFAEEGLREDEDR